MLRQLNKALFRGLLWASHFMTRCRKRAALARRMMRTLGALTVRVKGAQPQADAQSLAHEWQRMFPSRKMVPIVRIEGETAYAEIRSPCPYRGSGNVTGCHRMMEYDRRMMERIGGEFVVLRSQAEPGVQCCEVAIRPRGADTSDLVAAHERSQAGR